MALWAPPDVAHAQQPRDAFATLKAKFIRPTFVPHPADNPPSPAKVALGKRLFEDRDLSSSGAIACASCHDPKLSFSDGEPRGKGITGKRLVRHTPSLWNVAFSPLLFWDGRAASLEEQVRFPIEHPDEMGDTLDNAVHRFARHESYERDFAASFPDDPNISARNIARALTAYERTLISPPTRFDRWVAGDAGALSPSEIDGLKVFAGKGRCINCHTGFAFTDHNFYDIGLPGLTKAAARRSTCAPQTTRSRHRRCANSHGPRPTCTTAPGPRWKTSSRHYEKGGVQRPTRSKDLPRNLKLTKQERADLIAFLETLSSEPPPQPSTEAWVGSGNPHPAAAQGHHGGQPGQQAVLAGAYSTGRGADAHGSERRHAHPQRAHLRSEARFQLGRQEPNESVTIRFPVPGTFEAFCGIHPSMRLSIDVE